MTDLSYLTTYANAISTSSTKIRVFAQEAAKAIIGLEERDTTLEQRVTALEQRLTFTVSLTGSAVRGQTLKAVIQ